VENILHLGYRNQSAYVMQGKVTVCFEINTRRLNTVWAECTVV